MRYAFFFVSFPESRSFDEALPGAVSTFPPGVSVSLLTYRELERVVLFELGLLRDSLPLVMEQSFLLSS